VIARKHNVHLLARSLPRCLENSRYDICVNVEKRPIRGHGMSTMHWARNRTLCAVHLHSVPGTSFDGHPRQIKCITLHFILRYQIILLSLPLIITFVTFCCMSCSHRLYLMTIHAQVFSLEMTAFICISQVLAAQLSILQPVLRHY
jgi:hypothetical protein